MSIKVSKHKRVLKIEIPIDSPRPSASGKTMLIATSHGVKRTNVFMKGKEIAIIVIWMTCDERRTEEIGGTKMRMHSRETSTRLLQLPVLESL